MIQIRLASSKARADAGDSSVSFPAGCSVFMRARIQIAATSPIDVRIQWKHGGDMALVGETCHRVAWTSASKVDSVRAVSVASCCCPADGWPPSTRHAVTVLVSPGSATPAAPKCLLRQTVKFTVVASARESQEQRTLTHRLDEALSRRARRLSSTRPGKLRSVGVTAVAGTTPRVTGDTYIESKVSAAAPVASSSSGGGANVGRRRAHSAPLPFAQDSSNAFRRRKSIHIGGPRVLPCITATTTASTAPHLSKSTSVLSLHKLKSARDSAGPQSDRLTPDTQRRHFKSVTASVGDAAAASSKAATSAVPAVSKRELESSSSAFKSARSLFVSASSPAVALSSTTVPTTTTTTATKKAPTRIKRPNFPKKEQEDNAGISPASETVATAATVATVPPPVRHLSLQPTPSTSTSTTSTSNTFTPTPALARASLPNAHSKNPFAPQLVRAGSNPFLNGTVARVPNLKNPFL